MQPPGSTDARYLELAGYLGRETEDQEDLWLLVLERWHLTIDAWEALPWWQQQAYIGAHNRKVERENAENERQAAEAKRGQPKVAGRKNRPTPAKTSGKGGGRTKLRDSSLWAGRKTAPPSLPRMTGRRPPGAGGGQSPAAPPS